MINSFLDMNFEKNHSRELVTLGSQMQRLLPPFFFLLCVVAMVVLDHYIPIIRLVDISMEFAWPR